MGLPSELLRRRPDIRRVERELAAATARIGIATADLFPRFSLTGALGLQSVAARDFFTAVVASFPRTRDPLADLQRGTDPAKH